MGNALVIAGVVLILVGIFLSLGFPRLLGDILIQKGSFTFFFPLAACIVVSVVLTILFNLFRK